MLETATQRHVQRLVAGLGLPGTAGEAESYALAGLEWRRFFGMVGRQRLNGLALAAVEAGQLDLADWQLQSLLELQREAMIRALTLERTLVSLAASFESAGLDVIVLKGPALAHTLYPDPAWRPFGDLDLLVRTDDWDDACALLSDVGFTRRYREPRPGFSKRFGHTALHIGEDGVEVDLHRTLVAGPFGLWMEPEELFDHIDTFRLGGRTIRRLDDSGLFLNACVHASLGFKPPLLLPLRDVAQTVMTGDVDWNVIRDWSGRWRLSAVLQHACSAASESLDVTFPEQARTSLGPLPGRRERRALEAYTTERRSRGGKALAAIQAIPGWRGKIAYVSALLVPRREFLQTQAAEGAAPSYLRRWLTPIRWLARRS